MTEYKRMVFKLDPEQREEQGKLVERYLTALGYEDNVEWNKKRRHDNTRQYIYADSVKFRFMYMNDNCGSGTFETVPTPYQVEVAEHMATAPQDLAEYVRGRLPEGELTSSNNPFGCFYIVWQYTSEGYDFWRSVNAKDWESAMATDFWQKHTAPSEAPSQAPTIEEQFKQALNVDFVRVDSYSDKIAQVYDSLKEKQLRKNADYGDSAFQDIMVGGHKVSAVDACVARMSDKLKRLNSTGLSVSDESFQDTLDDLVGYIVIFKILNNGNE